jgi:hypothetical protein
VAGHRGNAQFNNLNQLHDYRFCYAPRSSIGGSDHMPKGICRITKRSKGPGDILVAYDDGTSIKMSAISYILKGYEPEIHELLHVVEEEADEDGSPPAASTQTRVVHLLFGSDKPLAA